MQNFSESTVKTRLSAPPPSVNPSHGADESPSKSRNNHQEERYLYFQSFEARRQR
jgi:hypothetical protein